MGRHSRPWTQPWEPFQKRPKPHDPEGNPAGASIRTESIDTGSDQEASRREPALEQVVDDCWSRTGTSCDSGLQHPVGDSGDRVGAILHDHQESPRCSAYRASRRSAPQPCLGQLALPVFTVPDLAISDALGQAVSVWQQRHNTGAISRQTLDRFTQVTTRFARYATAFGVERLADVDAAFVARFVHADAYNRRGDVDTPALATMHHRLTIVRGFFRTALPIGAVGIDPTATVTLPQRRSRTCRAMTSDEASLVRIFAESGASGATQAALTVALLLAGAHSAEIGWVAVSDVGAGTVAVRGTRKYRPRTISLDPWAARIVQSRVTYLTETTDMNASDPTLCTGSVGDEAHRQAHVGTVARHVLVRAGLGADPAIKPDSLTAYAARHMYEATGRIELAARLVGSKSLDSVARVIGLAWDT